MFDKENNIKKNESQKESIKNKESNNNENNIDQNYSNYESEEKVTINNIKDNDYKKYSIFNENECNNNKDSSSIKTHENIYKNLKDMDNKQEEQEFQPELDRQSEQTQTTLDKNYILSKFIKQPIYDISFRFLNEENTKHILPSKKFYFINDIEEEKEKNKEIELRKNVESGKSFKIIIQTYNHLIKELVVYPEMTIDMLKNLIEKNFMVSKEYQELLYLVYKLDENEKMLKDYYIRPNGIVFLRGYYFPLVFVDYFNKKNKNVISINIAEQIKYIRKKIITMLNLEDNYDYKLLLNGRTLDDEDYLINSNVQKMQMIYFK